MCACVNEDLFRTPAECDIELFVTSTSVNGFQQLTGASGSLHIECYVDGVGGLGGVKMRL